MSGWEKKAHQRAGLGFWKARQMFALNIGGCSMWTLGGLHLLYLSVCCETLIIGVGRRPLGLQSHFIYSLILAESPPSINFTIRPSIYSFIYIDLCATSERFGQAWVRSYFENVIDRRLTGSGVVHFLSVNWRPHWHLRSCFKKSRLPCRFLLLCYFLVANELQEMKANGSKIHPVRPFSCSLPLSAHHCLPPRPTTPALGTCPGNVPELLWS